MESFSPERTAVKVFFSIVCGAVFLTLVALPLEAADGKAPNLSPRLKFTIDGYDGKKFGAVSAVCFNAGLDELYVADAVNNEISIFTSDGTPVAMFDSKKGIINPIGIAVRGFRMYVIMGGEDRVSVFNSLGAIVKKIAPEGIKFTPASIKAGDDGLIYLAGTGGSGLFVIDKDDNVVSLGMVSEHGGAAAGMAVGGGIVYFFTPFAIGFRAVHAYDTKSGKYLFSFENIQDRGGTMLMPVSGRVDAAGNLWVVDSLQGITIYDDKSVKVSFLNNGVGSNQVADFPVDIDFSPTGMIYVADRGRSRILVYE